MAPAHQVDGVDFERGVWVQQGQLGQHLGPPRHCTVGQQRRPLGHGQGVVHRQHRWAGVGAPVLVHGIDVAQGRARTGGGEAHTVPRGRRTQAIEQRLAQVQIRHQPRRMRLPAGGEVEGSTQRIGPIRQQPRRDEQRQRHDDALGLPAFRPLSPFVPNQDVNAVPHLLHPQRRAPRENVLAQRFGHGLGEKGIALRPGEHGFTLGLSVARRMKTVPTGEVMQPRPGGHLRQPGAVVITATVIEVTQEALIGELLAGQPSGEGLRVQRGVAGCPRAVQGGH